MAGCGRTRASPKCLVGCRCGSTRGGRDVSPRAPLPRGGEVAPPHPTGIGPHHTHTPITHTHAPRAAPTAASPHAARGTPRSPSSTPQPPGASSACALWAPGGETWGRRGMERFVVMGEATSRARQTRDGGVNGQLPISLGHGHAPRTLARCRHDALRLRLGCLQRGDLARAALARHGASLGRGEWVARTRVHSANSHRIVVPTTGTRGHNTNRQPAARSAAAARA